jgi:hypothetical protein
MSLYVYRKSWIFSGYSGFFPQGMLTGWVGISPLTDPSTVAVLRDQTRKPSTRSDWAASFAIKLGSQLQVKPGLTRMRVDESWEARVCIRVFSTLMPRSNKNKSCMRVDESWEARVSMRVISTFVPRSNENKSCMRVDECWLAITSRVAIYNYFMVSVFGWPGPNTRECCES